MRPEKRTNSAPVITSVTIVPKDPNRESNLELLVQSRDPDGECVAYRLRWLKNDEEIPGEEKTILKSGNFGRGDLIRVKISPSDGRMNGDPVLSEAVTILNAPPAIEEISIEPKVAHRTDDLKVKVKASDPDGDSISFSYRWEKNGEALENDNPEVGGQGRFKKGDRIALTVTPSDGDTHGPSRTSGTIISNSPPVIISSPPASIQGNDYRYQVKAHDPDNDPIVFALKSGPKGMEIEKETGLIRWGVQNENKGSHLIEIEVSDNEGAKGMQKYELLVGITP